MSHKEKIKKIIIAGLISLIGIIILKYIPMKIFGKDILFDASAHITLTIFVLYICWFFIEKNRSWRIPYFVISAAILIIVAIQRIFSYNHNDIGIILGIIIGIISILISNWKYIHNRIKF